MHLIHQLFYLIGTVVSWRTATKVKLANFSVPVSSVMASNGVIHVIDEVILPN